MSTSVTAGNSLRNAMGQSLLRLADEGVQFVCGDCDVQGGTSLNILAQKYSERIVQFGICEQAAMAAGAGMALATGEPFVLPLFAVFASRAWEIFRLSVAYNRTNLKLFLSHVGPANVGPDGYSAASGEHISLWRTFPGVPVVWPCDATEMDSVVRWALAYQGPCIVFTGRSPTPDILKGWSGWKGFQLGKSQILRTGNSVTIFACGPTVATANEAANKIYEDSECEIDCRVVNLSSLKPVDIDLIAQCASETRGFVTVEDHGVGGLFSIVAETVTQHCHPVSIMSVGVFERFGESGEAEELKEHYGIGVSGVISAVKRVLS